MYKYNKSLHADGQGYSGRTFTMFVFNNIFQKPYSLLPTGEAHAVSFFEMKINSELSEKDIIKHLELTVSGLQNTIKVIQDSSRRIE